MAMMHLKYIKLKIIVARAIVNIYVIQFYYYSCSLNFILLRCNDRIQFDRLFPFQ